MNPQLLIEKLALGYDGQLLLENLNFELHKGDWLCIVGENGSGKTTLMKTLLGLHTPISGKIVWDKKPKGLGIGYLPQQTQTQKDFPASVMEIVLSGFQGHCGLRPFYTRDEKKKARENLSRMGMEEYSSRCYRELSGGQQQRVLLARALCATEDLLLLDEPVSGLDPMAVSHMYELIQELHDKDGITVIMVSHDIKTAIGFATHILHIGESVFFGTREEYLSSHIGRGFIGGEGI